LRLACACKPLDPHGLPAGAFWEAEPEHPVVPIVMSLIDAGYADHLLFSSDFSNATMLKRNNRELGYAKTLTVFVPKLKKAGASDEVLRQIMNDNPRRFLAFVPKVKRKA
jgi:predicted metal-dependent phosphotriesterase family hydrolase